jgi:hypothetical protein
MAELCAELWQLVSPFSDDQRCLTVCSAEVLCAVPTARQALATVPVPTNYCTCHCMCACAYQRLWMWCVGAGSACGTVGTTYLWSGCEQCLVPPAVHAAVKCLVASLPAAVCMGCTWVDFWLVRSCSHSDAFGRPLLYEPNPIPQLCYFWQ